ncbi:hypothetical protein SX4_2883 [Vibrio mimicus SX-4]|nr:hypothetical protein SX4_2883 [Vibrio mimicus SX-4]
MYLPESSIKNHVEQLDGQKILMITQHSIKNDYLNECERTIYKWHLSNFNEKCDDEQVYALILYEFS